MLNTADISYLLTLLGRPVVVQPSAAFPFTVVGADRSFGYSADPVVGALQAKLSIMLEAARRSSR